MPSRPLAPCSVASCPNRAARRGLCEEHARSIPRPSDERGGSSARGYGRDWQRLRGRFLKANPRCVVCGSDVDVEIDHIIPLERGGESEWSNLQTLCRTHHAMKTRRVDMKRNGRYEMATVSALEKRERR